MTPATDEIKTFLVPDLGEGLDDVTVTEWLVAVGERVELNQVLCSVETAKAQVEIPSPYAGWIIELGGAEGDVLAVGTPLVRIGTGSEKPAEARPESNGQAARNPVLVGYGADDGFDTSRRTPPNTATERPKAKPAARKLAAELGVDLGRVPAGRAGVITADDVRVVSGSARTGYDIVPLTPVQTAIAERMTQSRSEIPDAHARLQVDCTNLLRLRDELTGEVAITPFVLTLRLLVLALTANRLLNSTWVATPDGPQVHSHHAVHLGFGVAAPRGLLVPVITDAQHKTTRELADCVARLVQDARAGVLSPAQLRGSTFTVSNFGALGLDDGVPVINYPEAAILGMGLIRQRPAVVDGAIVARPQMTLTCAFDHRIADGAAVAKFLRRLRDLIESPTTALLDL